MKIFLSIFLISFIFNFANAEEINQSKSSIKKELSKEDEEFIQQFKKLDGEVKKEKVKTAEMENKTKELEKLEKTVDKLIVNKK